MNGKIEYGFGKEYLSKWTIKEAIREVFQNYIDYGKYTIETLDTELSNIINVKIYNNYVPEKLEFLRIGNSDKGDNQNSIGHHGEGLKMSFLIFLRENYDFEIRTKDIILKADWSDDDLIGKTLKIKYFNNIFNYNNGFVTQFNCPKDIYNEFINNIIKTEDKIYSHRFGDIVDKPKGNIYSGNLYICNIHKLNNAYNIIPSCLPLDRDRSIPNDFDIEWYTSSILQDFNKSKIEPVYTSELEGKDYTYTTSLPDNIVNQFSFKKVGNKNIYINKVDNEHIQNRRITDILDKHSKFAKAKKISNRKLFLDKLDKNKNKSLKTLIKEFKANYCKSTEMLDDINIILKRLNNK